MKIFIAIAFLISFGALCFGFSGVDKYLHFSVSFSAYGFSSYFLGDIGGLIFTSSIGIGKEVRDFFSPFGTAEIGDLLADMAGIIAARIYINEQFASKPLIVLYILF
ncbi:hypothetical protein AT15_01690 [Kosmotoga arenicorallina S304]|uniref:Uncharacterized protein n=1 Tax=Kosmotoga arenicorallina S304 TaxID=1453497 RepID=A0A176K0G9_9BACT|nr:hypothetical protein [Kosmotoga arenicorallina]OAA29773.1 hypothetical protein AT15_01690 [Kosmotoga arenicorallina S304]